MSQVMATLIVFIIKMFYKFLVYSSMIFIGYYLNLEICKYYPEVLPYSFLTWIGITMMIYQFFYFGKGMLIALKENKSFLWFLFFIGILLLTVGVPFLFVATGIFVYLEGKGVEEITALLWGAAGGLVVAWFVYKKYKFFEDNCPYLATWSYEAGYYLALLFYKNPRWTFYLKDKDMEYGSMILISYYLNLEICKYYPEVQPYFFLTWVGIGILIYQLFYFVKGIIIALKENKNFLWILFFIGILLLTVGVPLLFVTTEIWIYLEESKGVDSNMALLWGAAGGLVVAWFVYKKYKFFEDNCPYLATWSYEAGYYFVLLFYKNPRWTFCMKDTEINGYKIYRLLEKR